MDEDYHHCGWALIEGSQFVRWMTCCWLRQRLGWMAEVVAQLHKRPTDTVGVAGNYLVDIAVEDILERDFVPVHSFCNCHAYAAEWDNHLSTLVAVVVLPYY